MLMEIQVTFLSNLVLWFLRKKLKYEKANGSRQRAQQQMDSDDYISHGRFNCSGQYKPIILK